MNRLMKRLESIEDGLSSVKGLTIKINRFCIPKTKEQCRKIGLRNLKAVKARRESRGDFCCVLKIA